jgi:hypothetical protein
MEIMIPIIGIVGVVVWCWYWQTEPDRVKKLIIGYTNTVLLPISSVKDSYDPYDYVEPLSVAFARFLESDSGIVSSQPSESAMGFGHIMARTIIDDEVKDALSSERALDPKELAIKAVILRFHTKHPRYGSRHDGLIRTTVHDIVVGVRC